MATDTIITDRLAMTGAKAARWLLEFGRGWVHEEVIRDTWADEELHWHTAIQQGYLAEKDEHTDPLHLKLTNKAIKLIGDYHGY